MYIPSEATSYVAAESAISMNGIRVYTNILPDSAPPIGTRRAVATKPIPTTICIHMAHHFFVLRMSTIGPQRGFMNHGRYKRLTAIPDALGLTFIAM